MASPGSASRTGTGRTAIRVSSALVLLAAILPYANALPGAFVYDDVAIIRSNPRISGADASVHGLLTSEYQPGGGLYRPVTMLSYLANQRLGGSAFGFHLVNIVLHGVVSLEAYWLALWFLSPVGALIAGISFAVHPVHTEAVANIVGRAELLAAASGLGALLAIARWARGHWRGWRWPTVAVVAYALGALAKESALAVILLVPVVTAAARGPRNRWESLRAVVPLLAVAAAFVGMRWWVIGAVMLPDGPGMASNPLAYVPAWQRIGTAAVVLLRYAGLLTFPIVLSADYSFNQVPVVASPTEWSFVTAVLVGLGGAGGCWLAHRRAPALLPAVLFVVAPLALTANILFPIGTIMAERLLYLPSFGWCLGFGHLVEIVARRWKPVFALCAVGLVLFAGRTALRNRDWHSDFALWSATRRSAPNSSIARFNFAIQLDRLGDFDGAYREYARAVEIYPALGGAHYGMGTIAYRRGDLARAEAEFQAEIRLRPHDLRPLLGLGYVLQGQGRRDAVEQILATAAPRVAREAPEIREMFSRLRRRQAEAQPGNDLP